jgi:ribose transport system substrate-binding protein
MYCCQQKPWNLWAAAVPVLQTITAAALASAVILIATGCRSSRLPVIAVIPETTAQEIWESEHAGVAQAARAYHWNIYWNGPSREDDLPRQIAIVNRSVERHVQGILLSPDHAVALISPVRAALARNIPVIIVGSPLDIDPSGQLPFVLNDDAATGRIAAQQARPLLHAGDVVAVLGVDSDILASLQRANAFESSLSASMPGVSIIEERSTSFSFSEAEASAEELILSHSTLRLIVALNVNQTRAALNAILSTGSAGRMHLIGCDQDLDLMHFLREGKIDAMIVENTRKMGFDALQILYRKLHRLDVPVTTVVEPILVTRRNIDTPGVQKILEMNWRSQ